MRTEARRTSSGQCYGQAARYAVDFAMPNMLADLAFSVRSAQPLDQAIGELGQGEGASQVSGRFAVS